MKDFRLAGIVASTAFGDAGTRRRPRCAATIRLDRSPAARRAPPMSRAAQPARFSFGPFGIAARFAPARVAAHRS